MNYELIRRDGGREEGERDASLVQTRCWTAHEPIRRLMVLLKTSYSFVNGFDPSWCRWLNDLVLLFLVYKAGRSVSWTISRYR